MSLLGQWMGHANVAQQQYQLMGGALQGAANAAPNLVYGNAAPMGPPPTFSQNVPEDELVFIGICTRWPDIAQLAAMYPSVKKLQHDINCCQRMLML